jgi:chromate reductase
MTKIHLVALNGSLRKQSFNLMALHYLQSQLPENVTLEILDLSKIPFFNEDVEAEGIPEVVQNFKDKIALAQGILLATPEYNYSIPPVLKNALDWASRGKKVVTKKPTAILSASIGMFGGARVQYHLRQVTTALDMRVLNKPEVFITNTGSKFNADGELTDEKTQSSLKKLLEALLDSI